jgi:hypothetical protein
MQETTTESGKIDVKKLQVPLMPLSDYRKSHENLVIACHDVFMEYDGGILLVVRDNVPAKGFLWPIGGRIEKGVPILESLKKKVKAESNLSISNIKELGSARTLFATDPFGHGKGTDTLNIAFFAKASGKVKLDGLHKDPTIVKPKDYAKLRDSLHPYVREFMDKSIALIK